RVEVGAAGDGAEVVVDPLRIVLLQEPDFEQQRRGAVVEALDDLGRRALAHLRAALDLAAVERRELVAEEADRLRQVHRREALVRRDRGRTLALHELLARQAAVLAAEDERENVVVAERARERGQRAWPEVGGGCSAPR